MVMEFDQYLQLCEVTESHYRALYESVTKPPIVGAYRTAAADAKDTGLPSSPSTEEKPGRGDGDLQGGDAASPRENRCKWECNFDNDDTETLLTSNTVSLHGTFNELCICIYFAPKDRNAVEMIRNNFNNTAITVTKSNMKPLRERRADCTFHLFRHCCTTSYAIAIDRCLE